MGLRGWPWGTLRHEGHHLQKQKVPAWEGARRVPHAPSPGPEARTGSRLGVDSIPPTPGAIDVESGISQTLQMVAWVEHKVLLRLPSLRPPEPAEVGRADICTNPAQRPDSETTGQLRVSRSEERTSPWNFQMTPLPPPAKPGRVGGVRSGAVRLLCVHAGSLKGNLWALMGGAVPWCWVRGVSSCTDCGTPLHSPCL